MLRLIKPKLKPVFWRQMNGFLCLDNRQDLKLWPNWDRRNNNDERACLSAPFITSLVSQSRSLHEMSSVSQCAIIALHKLPVYKRT